jgi:7-cyano-7-deazaguanine synthase
MKKAIVLLSGGIDSATTLYLAKERGFKTLGLIFDYGQRHKKEIASAKKIAQKARSQYRVIRLPFSWKGSSLLDRNSGIPSGRSFKKIKTGIPSTYVPGRNLVFLAVSVSLAEAIGAQAVFIGAHSEDYSGYPDCRKDFFDAFRKTVKKGIKNKDSVKIYTPLIGKRKRDIIKEGIRLGVPIGLTWSCYKGLPRPCGACDSCRFRMRGFRELKLKDPLYGKS